MNKCHITTLNDAIAIVREYRDGKIIAKIAAERDVDFGVIFRIVNGVTWPDAKRLVDQGAG